MDGNSTSSSSDWQHALEALGRPVALLDAGGAIVASTRAWAAGPLGPAAGWKIPDHARPAVDAVLTGAAPATTFERTGADGCVASVRVVAAVGGAGPAVAVAELDVLAAAPAGADVVPGPLGDFTDLFSDVMARTVDQDQLERELRTLCWIPRIREALEEDRLVLHAQPIVDLATGRTVQHELLLRMEERDGCVVGPGEFLPIAEEYGFIGEIDRWVIARAAALAGLGQAVELNVSARSFSDPKLLSFVERSLRRHGADPSLMVFELTETAMLDDAGAARAFAAGIADLGCGLALDDFGTGYGGFTYLKSFPVNFLKIDVEFVRDLPRDAGSRNVVRAVVDLARSFGQQTVAEGVEDAETLALLRDLSVDFAQGFHLGRPASLDGSVLSAVRADRHHRHARQRA